MYIIYIIQFLTAPSQLFARKVLGRCQELSCSIIKYISHIVFLAGNSLSSVKYTTYREKVFLVTV